MSQIPSAGGALSAATVARIDLSVVDINADVAGGTGQVAGTGMIITSNGLVLTNNHVIDHTVNITAQIDGAGTTYKVKVIGYDYKDDVALVQLENASNLPTIPLGDSSKVSVGDAITVLGNALGKGGTPAEVTGTIAGLGAQITASDDSGNTEALTGMLQVSAAIQPGDSGGPEVNSAGQVIGMTTAGQTSGNPGQETASTTGFAIPVNKAMTIIAEIRSGSGTNIHIGNAALLGVAVATDPAGHRRRRAHLHDLAGTDGRVGQRRHREPCPERWCDRLRTDHRHRRRHDHEPDRPLPRDGGIPGWAVRDRHLGGRVRREPQRQRHARPGQLPRLTPGDPPTSERLPELSTASEREGGPAPQRICQRRRERDNLLARTQALTS